MNYKHIRNFLKELKKADRTHSLITLFSDFNVYRVACEVFEKNNNLEKIRKKINESIEETERHNKRVGEELPGYADCRTEKVPDFLRRLYAVLFSDINDMILYLNDEEPFIQKLAAYRLREDV